MSSHTEMQAEAFMSRHRPLTTAELALHWDESEADSEEEAMRARIAVHEVDSEDELVSAPEKATSSFLTAGASAQPVVDVIPEQIQISEMSSVGLAECSQQATSRQSSRTKRRTIGQTKRTLYRMDVDEVVTPARDSSLTRSYDALGAQFHNIADGDDEASTKLEPQVSRLSPAPVSQPMRKSMTRHNSAAAVTMDFGGSPAAGALVVSSPSGHLAATPSKSFGIVKVSRSCGLLPAISGEPQVALNYSEKKAGVIGRHLARKQREAPSHATCA